MPHVGLDGDKSLLFINGSAFKHIFSAQGGSKIEFYLHGVANFNRCVGKLSHDGIDAEQHAILEAAMRGQRQARFIVYVRC